MIKRSYLSKIWKKTIIHLVIIDMIAVIILASFFIKRIDTSTGPTFLAIALMFTGILVANIAFFFAARHIKNEVSRRRGVD
jgi:uncharacterized membrane protein YdbT with pleckstrin-like domain